MVPMLLQSYLRTLLNAGELWGWYILQQDVLCLMPLKKRNRLKCIVVYSKINKKTCFLSSMLLWIQIKCSHFFFRRRLLQMITLIQSWLSFNWFLRIGHKKMKKLSTAMWFYWKYGLNNTKKRLHILVTYECEVWGQGKLGSAPLCPPKWRHCRAN